jgi:predicted ribosomally synthesized peptide with nif11-like leader
MAMNFEAFRDNVLRDLALRASLERATSAAEVVQLGRGLGFQFEEKDVVSALTSTQWYKPEIMGDELKQTAAAVEGGTHSKFCETDSGCGTTMTWNHCYSC